MEARGTVATFIVQQVTKVPVFDLDELLNYVAACPGTGAHRVVYRLNAKLDQKPSADEVSLDELTDKARASYERKQHDFMIALRTNY
jgi:hypothetical protein